MNNFLLELLSEEIPASEQAYGRRFLENYFKQKLDNVKLAYSEISSFSSPRRLIVHIKGIEQQAPSKKKEKRGPREGCDEKALEGFIVSNKVRKDELKIEKVNGKNYYFLFKEEKGEKIETYLDCGVGGSDFPGRRLFVGVRFLLGLLFFTNISSS